MDFVSGRDAPTIINQYIIRELIAMEYVPESTTIASEELRGNQNVFEWMADLVKKFTKLIS